MSIIATWRSSRARGEAQARHLLYLTLLWPPLRLRRSIATGCPGQVSSSASKARGDTRACPIESSAAALVNLTQRCPRICHPRARCTVISNWNWDGTLERSPGGRHKNGIGQAWSGQGRIVANGQGLTLSGARGQGSDALHLSSAVGHTDRSKCFRLYIRSRRSRSGLVPP